MTTYQEIMNDNIAKYGPEPIHIRLGAKLGNGGYKTAYELPDLTDKVGLICRDTNQGIKEYELLKKLTDCNIPALKVHEILVNFNTLGDKNYGVKDRTIIMIVDRYLLGSKDGEFRRRMAELITEKSVEGAIQIIDGLKKNNLYVTDPQFLIAKDGSVVISDPLDITVSDYEMDFPIIKNMKKIHAFLQARKVQDPSTNKFDVNYYGVEPAAIKWFEATIEAKEEAYWSAREVLTQKKKRVKVDL